VIHTTPVATSATVPSSRVPAKLYNSFRLQIPTTLVATAANNRTNTPVATAANGHTVYTHLPSSTPIMIMIRSDTFRNY